MMIAFSTRFVSNCKEYLFQDNYLFDSTTCLQVNYSVMLHWKMLTKSSQ